MSNTQTPRPSRPWSVILLQGVLAVVSVPVAMGLVNSAATNPRAALTALLWLGLYLVTSWALFRRQPVGRWLGLLCISGFLALQVPGLLEGLSAPRPKASGVFHSDSQRASRSGRTAYQAGHDFGYQLGLFIMPSLTLCWFVLFGFSRKSQAFFGDSIPAEARAGQAEEVPAPGQVQP